MTIDRLGESMILVTLMLDDMRRYQLDFDGSADSRTTRRGLTKLMVQVGEECGMDHRGKSYLIEALPAKDSCLLIISVRAGRPRRRYRIKRERTADCCCFASADELLDWLSRPLGVHTGYALYLSGGRYYLLPEYPWTASECAALNEYGTVTRESPVAVARIREHGRLILEHPDRRRFHFRNASSAAI